MIIKKNGQILFMEKSTFFQFFQPIFSEKLWAKLKQENPTLDRYAKKLHSHQLIQLLMLAQLQQFKGLVVISKRSSTYMVRARWLLKTKS